MADPAPSSPPSPPPPAGGPARSWAQRAAAPSLLLVLALTTLVYFGGVLLKAPCRDVAWGSHDTQYRLGCYSDIPLLYVFRGFADGQRAYVDVPAVDGRYLEYPVLTGAVMQVAAWAVGTEGTVSLRMVRFYDITVVMLWLFALLLAAAVWSTRPRGPTASLMVALSPALLLTATINWDLIAVALTAGAVWAWSRQRPLLTGVLLGLGAAAKLYPAFLLGPILVLCLHRAWHARRRGGAHADVATAEPGAGHTLGPWRTLLATIGGALVAWTLVNLPVIALAPRGWGEFYTFSQTRGIDFGSPWLALDFMGAWTLPAGSANLVTGGLFLLLCLVIGLLGLLSPRPSFAQLAFLVVAAFAVSNKVYSPQYVLWLVPLAALARPRWGLFLVWQAAEALYWFGVWRFLLGYGQPEPIEGQWSQQAYAWAIWVHVAATAALALVVALDMAKGRPGGDDPSAERDDGGGQDSRAATAASI